MVADIINQRARQKIASNNLIKYGVLIAPLLVGNVYADGNPTFIFDLPEQPLSDTLDSLAQSTQTRLLYADATVKGLRSAPVKGNFTAQQALGKSGLNYKVVDKSLITVAGQASAAPETVLKPMTVEGDGVRDPNDPYNPDYNRTDASTATKTDTPIMETPYSVTVVPQQVLKDQRFIRVEDGIRNVAGEQSSYANGGDSDFFIMRGFENLNLYRDGFLLPSALGGGTVKRQTANLERVEVLKGPGSLLFGRNEPGGVINLVTKRPQATPYHSVEQQFGSYDFYRTLVDSTGAITHDDTLLYRVNLSSNPGPDISQEWYALYWQDQIKFPFNVYGNVGVRYDNANGANNANGLTTTDDDHFSPRGGLLWKPLNWLAVYGNYSENFGPSNSLFRSIDQQALPPRTGEEWELGAKTEFFDGRLSASFAYFDLTQKNVAVPDPINPNLSRAIGEQESRGYELEAAGEILLGWRIIGAYTHMSYANVNQDVGFDGGLGNKGNRMFNTPRNFGSLWSTYEFLGGDLQGLKLGGGVNAASQSQGTNANTFQLPGYATLNLMASYGLNVGKSRVTLQLNASNLLDKTYYQGSNTGYMIGAASPRTCLGSVRVEF